VRLFLDAFPDLQVTPNLVVANGELVAVDLLARGMHEGGLRGSQTASV
jgi:hypothetical protein